MLESGKAFLIHCIALQQIGVARLTPIVVTRYLSNFHQTLTTAQQAISYCVAGWNPKFFCAEFEITHAAQRMTNRLRMNLSETGKISQDYLCVRRRFGPRQPNHVRKHDSKTTKGINYVTY